MPRAHMCESGDKDWIRRVYLKKAHTHTAEIWEEFVFYWHGLTANM